jgi:hypothetical protein
MTVALTQSLMEEFAETTGVSGKTRPRRYLWTDAFAVCNFLGLFRQTGDDRFLRFARELVDQVHHILGRHRDDDPRRGWISGLSEVEGERHPTRGGLRIGKPLNEREPHEPANSQLEWEQDGQYFHYLTKWMHALYHMSKETGDSRYQRWAVELAVTAHHAFTGVARPGGAKRMVWKMSIDLTRPLVSSMGQLDPLDGLVTYLELQTTGDAEAQLRVALTKAIEDMTDITAHIHLASDDPLGIGGLLDNAARLAQLIFQRGIKRSDLLHQILVDARLSLEAFSHTALLGYPADRRLAFRELGLSIGLHGLRQLRCLVAQDSELVVASDRLLPYRPLAKQISSFWSDPAHRLSRTWKDHRDINLVMLATSLSPESYLEL